MNEDQSGEPGYIGRYSEQGHQDHAKGFSKALQHALQQARDDGAIDVGRHYESEVRFFIDIEVTNPPWVGDYRAWIDPRERP